MSISSTGLYGSATLANSDLFNNVETLKETVTTLNTTYLQTNQEHREDISQNRQDISSNLNKISFVIGTAVINTHTPSHGPGLHHGGRRNAALILHSTGGPPDPCKSFYDHPRLWLLRRGSPGHRVCVGRVLGALEGKQTSFLRL
jgi:hypothetical protein